MNKNIEICKLCLKNKVLVDSHIIPKFIFKWIKETSATGYLRFSQKKNQRAQDGVKCKLLCSECESILSKFEGEFANKIFYPYVENPKVVARYGSWLLKFIVSLTWRSLLFAKDIKTCPFTEEQIKSSELALEIWRKFLLGEVDNPGIYEQHFIPFDEIIDAENVDLPSNINRYLLRGTQIDCIANKDQAFSYVKIPFFAFFGAIMIKKKKWKSTLVHVNNGLLHPKTYSLPGEVSSYILEASCKTERMEGDISLNQKAKIEKDINKNLEKFQSSHTFSAMKADIVLSRK